ncbi:hypothetical protein ACIF8T_17160 [Streptomyces sp. NPDC085946]|uniref:hypothetical protein n=1 Tax=Streptomyces sp. NPDC085946 TaxID=3365744 RepID=UPI0037D1141C
MYDYELHQLRSADLVRRAERQRLVRQALLARRDAAPHAAEAESHTRRSRRHRFARAA